MGAALRRGTPAVARRGYRPLAGGGPQPAARVLRQPRTYKGSPAQPGPAQQRWKGLRESSPREARGDVERGGPDPPRQRRMEELGARAGGGAGPALGTAAARPPLGHSAWAARRAGPPPATGERQREAGGPGAVLTFSVSRSLTVGSGVRVDIVRAAAAPRPALRGERPLLGLGGARRPPPPAAGRTRRDAGPPARYTPGAIASPDCLAAPPPASPPPGSAQLGRRLLLLPRSPARSGERPAAQGGRGASSQHPAAAPTPPRSPPRFSPPPPPPPPGRPRPAGPAAGSAGRCGRARQTRAGGFCCGASAAVAAAPSRARPGWGPGGSAPWARG